MKVKKLNDNLYLLKVYKDEEVMASLIKFHKEYSNSGLCKVDGIGAVEEPHLGYLKDQGYINTQFKGDYEVVSMTGSIALKDGEPLPHIHMAISDIECRSFGGHLISAIVSATLEVFITTTDVVVERKLDPEVGLALMDI